MQKILVTFLFLGLLCSASAARNPAWLKDIRPKTLPQFVLDENPDAVVLRDSAKTVIGARSVFTTTTSQAILIRNIDGFTAARASIPYTSDTDKILSFRAWVISPKGKVITFHKNDFVDAIASDHKNIATTARARSINARGDVKIGSIFAFEAVVENKDIFSQDIWRFQGPYPMVSSSIAYEYPDGWRIEPVFFNMDSIPVVETKGKKSTHQTWISKSIPGLEFQPYSPASNEIARWAAFNIVPPEKSSRKLYQSWKEISEKRTPTYDSLAVVSPEMRETVNELTANSSDTLQTIKTLSELAQSINYISVALDLGKGGGYKPRPSNEVFETNYGDCKDKTNLLHGLLKVKGIDLYPLIVYSGKTKIFEEWPSSKQFNHCIAAIKIDDSFSSPATIDHPDLGKLLLFDPTSTFTPFGDLPSSLQGSKGLILAGDKGGLITMPRIPLDKSLLKRDIEMELLKNGRAYGKIKEVSLGQAARLERQYAFTKDSDYAQLTKDWIAENLPGAEIGELKTEDDKATGNFTLDVEFGAPTFAKNMRNVLLIFKPVMLNRISAHPFGDEERTQPVDIATYNLDESIKIYIPEGYEISELPDNVKLEESFGSYSLSFELEDNAIHVSRSIKIHPVRIPTDEYEALESFFKNRIKADQSTVVLERS
jgi:hypothetical protein